MADGNRLFLENIQRHLDVTINFTPWLPEASEIPEPGMLALTETGILGIVGFIIHKRPF